MIPNVRQGFNRFIGTDFQGHLLLGCLEVWSWTQIGQSPAQQEGDYDVKGGLECLTSRRRQKHGVR